MYEKSIHPLELISFNQSFQNLSIIDSFFSKLLKVKLFEEVKLLQVRLNEDSEIISFSGKEIFEKSDFLFNARHELVHNPSNNMKIELEEIEKILEHSTTLIFGIDIVLSRNFNEHK